MNRRSFIALTAAALVALTAPVQAAEPQQGSPFREVRLKAEDSRKVIVFFAFSCPVCAQYHLPLAKWASTLPKDWQAEFVPAISKDRDGVMSARAYYAAKIADAGRLEFFVEAAYNLIHDKGMSPGSYRTWEAAASAAGIAGYSDAWSKVRLDDIRRAAKILVTYGVDETPSMAIGGRYVITPNNTNGDGPLFIQLANGVISKVIASR